MTVAQRVPVGRGAPDVHARPQQALAGIQRDPRVLSVETDGVASVSVGTSVVTWGQDRIDPKPTSGDGFVFP